MTKTILVADDSKTIRHVVNLTFHATGFRVVAAGSAQEAFQRAGEERPDLVLADVGMPGMDGYQLCEHLKQDARTAGIPVLLMAGAFEPFDERRAQAARADGHIRKPFDTQTLLDQVKALTGERVDAAVPLSFAATLAQRAGANNGPAAARAPERTAPPPPPPPPAPAARAPDVDDLVAAPQRTPAFGAPEREQRAFSAPEPEVPRLQARGWEEERAPEPEADAWEEQRPPEPVWADEEEADDAPYGAEQEASDDAQVAARGAYGPTLEPPTPPTPADEAHRRSVDVWALQDEGRAHDDEITDEQEQGEPIQEIEIEDLPPEEAPRGAAFTAPVAEAIADRAAPAFAQAAAAAVPGVPNEALIAAAREVIERIAWEVVPELAETIIREEIRRLLREQRG